MISILASASADMTIKLWDFQGYENIKTLHGMTFISMMISVSVLFSESLNSPNIFSCKSARFDHP